MKEKQKVTNKGFTLIELLIVVLIIGILAGIALPKYREIVEKTIMQEAVVNLKAIVQAQERFYMINGRYANNNEMDQLDIVIPGEIKKYSQTGLSGKRIVTELFIYSARTGAEGTKGVAHRIKRKEDLLNHPYYLVIAESGRISCYSDRDTATSIQRRLCTQFTGSKIYF